MYWIKENIIKEINNLLETKSKIVIPSIKMIKTLEKVFKVNLFPKRFIKYYCISRVLCKIVWIYQIQ